MPPPAHSPEVPIPVWSFHIVGYGFSLGARTLPRVARERFQRAVGLGKEGELNEERVLQL